MTKIRSNGNTIATRGNGGGIGTREMGDRINHRLQETREVRVRVESRTRGQMEEVDVIFDPTTPGQVNVRSQSGNTYVVDTEEDTCTCPDYYYRGRRCRHLDAVAIAEEQTPEGRMVGSTTDTDMNVSEALAQHIRSEEEEERSNIARTFTDDNHFYQDSPEEFDQDFERLKNTEVPYEYDNVLNGSDVTFGIELEFVDGDSNAIARELYGLGLCSSPSQERYHAIGTPGKWTMQRDGSVSVGRYGGEIVSPILKDTPQTWENLKTICEVAKRHGARVNTKTGGHVHVDADPLDGKRQRWRRLFKTVAGTEETLYRLAGGELGKFRGGSYASSAATTMKQGMRMRLPEEGSNYTFKQALRQGSFTRTQSVNLTKFTGGGQTIEVRAFNGSLTPGIIQANVKAAVGIVHTAERSRTQGMNEGLTTESYVRRGEQINNVDTNHKTKEAMIKFVDTLFTRKNDKEHIISVLAKNQWK